VLIGVGPDADRRAKLLIHQAIEGAILDAYLHIALAAMSEFIAAANQGRENPGQSLPPHRGVLS
jgi:hypothetical protein